MYGYYIYNDVCIYVVWFDGVIVNVSRYVEFDFIEC